LHRIFTAGEGVNTDHRMNDKQKLYAKARLKGLNQTQSAIEAGYSPATARQAASRLEGVPEVAKALQDLKSPLNRPLLALVDKARLSS
jgi:phage terminase small subunit